MSPVKKIVVDSVEISIFEKPHEDDFICLTDIVRLKADEAVLKQGIDATQYQLLLVKIAVGVERFQMANGFNHTKLKNRIMMMQKNKSNKLARLAYLACLPLLLGTLCFCSSNNSNKTKIVESVCKEIDEEVLRVLNSSPKWTPAISNGKNVPVELCMPFEFQLK